MKIKLIFSDWLNKDGNSEYNQNNDLSSGIFHSGTTFDGEIKLNEEDEAELTKHMQGGFRPVFWVMMNGVIEENTDLVNTTIEDKVKKIIAENRCFFCNTPTQATENGQSCPKCGGRPA